MAFLSRLKLNPRCRQVQVDLRSPYEMHRTLLKAFPDGLSQGESRGVLWRLDTDVASADQTVLVQSKMLPDWDKLPDGYLSGPSETRSRDETFQQGRRLAFRLRANPTVKRNGQRLGLITEEQQFRWLERKAKEGGFRLLSFRVTPYQFDHAEKKNDKETRKLTHLSVQFDGLLEVTDPVKFLETLRAGIGSAKGFGFGLLSLARPEACHAHAS